MTTFPTSSTRKHVTPATLSQYCKEGKPIVCLSVYDYYTAALADTHVDVLLVGDSLATALYGHDTTLNTSLDSMIRHGECVARAAKTALVVVDLPFGSYQRSPSQAFASAARILQETEAYAVKLEGGQEMAETIRFLVDRGVPVMAHIGMQPQRVREYGGFRTQGKNPQEAEKIENDLKAICQAGAFATVLEATRDDVSKRICKNSSIPVIGIGAGNACHGQILVGHDVLGMIPGFKPKFVRRYLNGSELAEEAFKRFAQDVRSGLYPSEQETFY